MSDCDLLTYSSYMNYTGLSQTSCGGDLMWHEVETMVDTMPPAYWQCTWKEQHSLCCNEKYTQYITETEQSLNKQLNKCKRHHAAYDACQNDGTCFQFKPAQRWWVDAPHHFPIFPPLMCVKAAFALWIEMPLYVHYFTQLWDQHECRKVHNIFSFDQSWLCGGDN